MHHIARTCLDTLAAGLFLVPLYLMLQRYRYKDWKTTAWYLCFALYLCAVYAVAGLPSVNYIRMDFNYNAVPFLYMFSDLENTILNVVLFLPLGFFLSLLWPRFDSLWKAAAMGLAISAGIEFLQLFTFRATDINDLMTNTLGAFLGCCAAKAAKRAFHPPIHSPGELTVICGSVFGVMFFLHPLLTTFLGI